MNDRELTQIVQNHTGFPWFNGKAYVGYHGIDVGQPHIERIAELEAALDEIQGLCPTLPQDSPTPELGGFYGSQLQVIGIKARKPLKAKP
ncbi:hypothetical protein DB2_38 [Octadecabacter Antarctic DB virus 2]|nr:hypothetical protein DB2_38 [Octadecabacter Antarctic DB virus 2]